MKKLGRTVRVSSSSPTSSGCKTVGRVANPPHGLLEMIAYQSLPRTAPSLGLQACHHVNTEMLAETVRTLPSPRLATIVSWGDCVTKKLHAPVGGFTWNGMPLGGTAWPELKSAPRGEAKPPQKLL